MNCLSDFIRFVEFLFQVTLDVLKYLLASQAISKYFSPEYKPDVAIANNHCFEPLVALNQSDRTFKLLY